MEITWQEMIVACCSKRILVAPLMMLAFSSCHDTSEPALKNVASRSGEIAERAIAPEQGGIQDESGVHTQPAANKGSTNNTSTVNPQDEIADPTALKLTPSDAVLSTSTIGDLNGDGIADVLAVFEDKDQEESEPRRLVIFLGAAEGRFEKVVDNTNAILCRSCGGTMGDPLVPIAVEPKSFILRFQGGSRELWSRAYRFAYSPADRDWYLVDTEVKALDRIGGDGQDKTVKAQPRAISIKDFDAAAVAEDAES